MLYFEISHTVARFQLKPAILISYTIHYVIHFISRHSTPTITSTCIHTNQCHHNNVCHGKRCLKSCHCTRSYYGGIEGKEIRRSFATVISPSPVTHRHLTSSKYMISAIRLLRFTQRQNVCGLRVSYFKYRIPPPIKKMRKIYKNEKKITYTHTSAQDLYTWDNILC